MSAGVCTRLLHNRLFVDFIWDVCLFLDVNSTHIVSFFFALVVLCGLVGVIYFCYKRYKHVTGHFVLLFGISPGPFSIFL